MAGTLKENELIIQNNVEVAAERKMVAKGGHFGQNLSLEAAY